MKERSSDEIDDWSTVLFVFSLRITPIGAFLGFRFPVDTSDTAQFRLSGTGCWVRPSLSW